jgi:hypothetical protein
MFESAAKRQVTSSGSQDFLHILIFGGKWSFFSYFLLLFTKIVFLFLAKVYWQFRGVDFGFHAYRVQSERNVIENYGNI